jgi:hypothetical protein
VDTCYCGTSRAAVVAQAERDRHREGGSFPSLTLLLEIAAIAALFYFVLSLYRAEQAPPPAPAAAATVEPTPMVAADPALTPPANEGPGFAAVVPARSPSPEPWPEYTPTPTPPAPSPKPRPTPSAKPERAEIDVEREAGERRLAQALARLEAEVTRLAANARQFESVCLSTRADRGSCERVLAEMSSTGERLGQSLDSAEDDARRSWVSPGVVRDLRRRHGLEEGMVSDLTSTVRRLASQYRSGS